MPQISPKFTFWFGVWTNVLLLIASMGIDQAPHVVAQYAPTVQWFCMTLYKINNAVLTALVGLSSTQAGPLVKLPPVPTSTIVKILIVAFLISFSVASAQAQGGKFRNPSSDPIQQFNEKVKQDFSQGAAKLPIPLPAAKTDPTAPLPCMDIKMLVKLTPDNLVPTMKGCAQDINNQLVSDTTRALASAKAYVGPAGGNPGDNDAVNCLTPALALFQAAAIIPAVPAVPAVAAEPAVLNPDGSVKTPAVAGSAAIPGTPEVDPGPILLFQKYREFVLAGALTSCQAWFNQPVTATTAANIGAAGAVVGAAALGTIVP